MWGVGQVLDAGEPPAWIPDYDLGPLTEGDFPPAEALAAAVAALTAAAPWLTRKTRRWGWTLLIVLAVSRALAAPISADTLLALAAGWAAGAAVLVVGGAPTRRPGRDAISTGLGLVGVHLAELHPAAVDARGSTPYFGTTTDGTRLFVKVLGDNERSADLLFKFYRRLLPSDLGDERVFSSLRRAVEHEAVVAYAARDLGVRTPRVVAFARAEPHGFVLAYEAIAGRSLDSVDASELDDERLVAAWQQIFLLREHGIAHRDLRLANVFLTDEGEVWIIDFGFSELAASDLLLATDLAELVTSLSLQVGPQQAVASARHVLGVETLVTATPRLEPRFLAGATRTAVKSEPETFAELRRLVASSSAPDQSRSSSDGQAQAQH